MKKVRIFLGLTVLIIAAILVSGKVIMAQPRAKKICFYPKNSSGNDTKLEDLKPGQSVCFEDEGTLKAFNSSSRTILKFAIYKGGFYGSYTDDRNKVHLIIVALSDAIIIDVTSKKNYTIKDEKMMKLWYDAINTAHDKVSSLE